MNIGIIGAGRVGGAIGRLLTARSHAVMFGVRNPQGDRVQALLSETGARAGTVAEAVAFGEVVVLAVPGHVAEDAVASAGGWTGKILIDATNRFFPAPPDSAGSQAEDVARRAVGARVVKAFNTMGARIYASPQFGDQAATMFICGDDADAKSIVGKLAESLGFEVIDAGPLNSAAHLEALARFWVHLAGSAVGRDIAFKLLRR